MLIKSPHSWDLSYTQAVAVQKRLAQEVLFCRINKNPKLIAGIDCSRSKNSQEIIGGVVVLNWPELGVIEKQYAVKKLQMPYIPGLLSFREGPVCIEAVEKLCCTPDLFIVDGQGIAHPRRIGLAAHLGLIFGKATIGCAKSRLCGQFVEPGSEKGDYSYLTDRDENIGAVLRTRKGVKPVFVSVGNMCQIDQAVDWVLRCAVKYRLPEPTRLADKFVREAKNKL